MVNFIFSSMPRMRNNQGQRIDPRTGQPYESYSDYPDTIYPIRPSHEQHQPRSQHLTYSDPQPTPSRPQSLDLTYYQPSPGLEEHFF